MTPGLVNWPFGSLCIKTEDVTGNNGQLNHRLDKVFVVAALPYTKKCFWGGASLVLHIMSYIVWIYVKFPSAKDWKHVQRGGEGWFEEPATAWGFQPAWRPKLAARYPTAVSLCTLWRLIKHPCPNKSKKNSWKQNEKIKKKCTLRQKALMSFSEATMWASWSLYWQAQSQ